VALLESLEGISSRISRQQDVLLEPCQHSMGDSAIRDRRELAVSLPLKEHARISSRSAASNFLFPMFGI
jgi:hypothetical protein